MSAAFLVEQIQKSVTVKQALSQDSVFLADFQRACELCLAAYRGGCKLLIAGNGGSAGDAQHLAAELVGRYYYDRPALPALALTTDTSILTAIGNDYGYELLFSRQIEGNGNAGDIFLGISTSGNSPNILRAIESARAKSLHVIGLTGDSGGKMRELCDICLRVPSSDTPRIQESHILIGHILCQYLESQLFPK